MIGKVDDNIIRMIYKSEFVPVPTVPTAVDDDTETDDVEVEDTEDEIEDNSLSGT